MTNKLKEINEEIKVVFNVKSVENNEMLYI